MSAEKGPLPPLAELYAGAPCGLLLTDPDGTIRHANDAFCEWMGYPLAELAGKRRIQELLTVGGRIFHQTHWAPLLHMQGSIAEVKVEFLPRSGRPFPVVMNAVSKLHDGRPFHELALFVAQDRHRYEKDLMEARVRAEELLAAQLAARRALALANARERIALESARLHVWNVDPTTGRRHFNDSVAVLLGFPAPEAITDEAFKAHVAPADREAEANAFARALEAEQPPYDCVFRINGEDGLQRTVRATGEASFSESRLVHFVGVMQDITELSVQRAAAEDRARLAEQMVGIVSHDLRNPLTAVRMGMQMLTDTAMAASRRERVHEHMEASIERALRLVQDLLDFTQARIGSGLTVTLQDVDIHGVVAEAIDELRLAFPERSVVHVQHGSGQSAADPDRLLQMLGNLVGNAMAYGAVDQPVTITTRVGVDSFAIDVHNYGKPIPHDLLPVLFEPMTRGTPAGGEQRSVGLGLFIVKDIVRAHRGTVEVTSEAGTGTVFRVELPRA